MNLRNSYLQGLQNFYNSKASEGFVYVKGMDFDGKENLYPESEVFIKNRKIHIDDFWMCDHPVTQDEFKAVFPKGYKPCFKSDVTKGEIQGGMPVSNVNWYSAIAYCNKRSVLEGLTPCYTVPGVTNIEGFSWGNFAYSSILADTYDAAWDGTVYDPSADGYRLPTEIEWEYAARGGVFLESFEYPGSDNIDEVAWYNGNSLNKPHKVKKKAPNKLGLYDMSGNIGEWCWDRSGDINTNTPGTGSSSGSLCVIRGGCWDFFAACCTVSYRSKGTPYYCFSNYGFRVVRSYFN